MVGDESGRKARRNRTSYVCMACKKRKSRCDRDKPCSKCVELKTNCIYVNDTKSSTDNNMISKPTIDEAIDNKVLLDKIIMLENQLRFWKNKAQYPPRDLEVTLSASSTQSEIISDTDYRFSSAESVTRNASHLRIELDDNELTYIPNKFAKTLNLPFGFVSFILRDFNLRTIFSSVHGFTYTELIKLVGDKDITLHDIFTYATANKNQEERPLPCFLEEVLLHHLKRLKNQSTINMVSIPIVFLANNDKIERFASEGFPIFLKDLIKEIQNAICENKALFDFHLRHFFEHIYPLYPFLEISSFLREIRRIVSFAETGHSSYSHREKGPSVDIDKNSLRSDLEKIALLMVILQLTHDSLESLDNSEILERFESLDEPKTSRPGDTWLGLSHQILFMLSCSRFPSEDTFCCQLYQSVCIYLSSKENLLLSDRQPVIQLGNLLQSSRILGLHKDPSKYKRMLDSSFTSQELLNYRRKLWFGLCNLIYQQSLPAGCDAGINEYNSMFFMDIPENVYMEFIRKDFGDYNMFDFQIVHLLLEKHQLGSTMVNLNKACTSNPPAPVSVVLQLITTLESELSKFITFNSGAFNDANEIALPFDNASIDMSQVHACESILMRIVSDSLVLNIYWALFLKLDSKARFEPMAHVSIYVQLFEKTILSCFEMTNFLLRTFKDELDKDVGIPFHYCLSKHIQQSIVRVFLCVTSLILKVKTLIKNCNNEVKNDNPNLLSATQPKNQRKLSEVKKLCAMLEDLLKSLAEACRAMQHARKLKMFNKIRVLLDYLNQIVDLDRMLEVSTRFWDYKAKGISVHNKVQKAIKDKWGMEYENSNLIISRFYSESSLNIIDEGFWTRILQRVEAYQSHTNLPMPFLFEGSNQNLIEPLISETPLDLNVDFSALFNVDSTMELPHFSF